MPLKGPLPYHSLARTSWTRSVIACREREAIDTDDVFESKKRVYYRSGIRLLHFYLKQKTI